MNEKYESSIEKLILVILTLGIFILGFFFVRSYRQLRGTAPFSSYKSMLEERISHGPLGGNDTLFIRPWMTFNYLNSLFQIPPGYLQTSLSISNIHYPNLSISTYAKAVNKDAAGVLEEVKNAIKSYFTDKK